MKQIPDAPWIREAEMNGFPVGNDEEEEDDETGDLLSPDELREYMED